MALDSASALIQSGRIQCLLLTFEGPKWLAMILCIFNKFMLLCVNSIVVIDHLILSFDGVLQLVIKRFIQLLIRNVFHSLYFDNKPSCWSSPTATDKTSLITFASDSVSLFGPIWTILEGQLFWSCNDLGPDHQSVGIFCGLHPLDATSAGFSSVGTKGHWM